MKNTLEDIHNKSKACTLFVPSCNEQRAKRLERYMQYVRGPKTCTGTRRGTVR